MDKYGYAGYSYGSQGYLVAITTPATVTVESTTSATSTASTSKSASASTSKSTAPGRPIFSWSSFIHGKLTSFDFAAVEGRNRRVCGFARIHLDKSKSA